MSAVTVFLETEKSKQSPDKNINYEIYIHFVSKFLKENKMDKKGVFYNIKKAMTVTDHFEQDYRNVMIHEYSNTFTHLQNLIKFFGVEKYDCSNSEKMKIFCIDLSWPNLRKKIEKIMEQELIHPEKNDKKRGELHKIGTMNFCFDNLPELKVFLGEFQYIFNYIERIEDAPKQEGPTKNQIEYMFNSICLNNSNEIYKSNHIRFFDLINIDRRVFKEIIEELVCDISGFQLLMSITTVISLLYIKSIKIKLGNEFFVKKNYKNEYEICFQRDQDVKSMADFLYISLCKIYYDLINYIAAGSLIEEDINPSRWFTNFSITNSTPEILDKFYPWLKPENMKEPISRIKQMLMEMPNENKRKKLPFVKNMCQDIVIRGFGFILFSPESNELNLNKLLQNDEFLAKVLYINACAIPLRTFNYKEGFEYDNNDFGDEPWINDILKMTYLGENDFLFANDFGKNTLYKVINNQNLIVYRMRVSGEKFSKDLYKKCFQPAAPNFHSNASEKLGWFFNKKMDSTWFNDTPDEITFNNIEDDCDDLNQK